MVLEGKTIGIIGAYDHPNFGDQLLFNILHGWIKENCQDVTVRVLWGDPKGIQWPDGVLVGGGVKKLLRCNAVIFGGGGYFGESGSNTVRWPEQYTKLDKIGMALHLPKKFGGIYFGPKGYLRSETFRFIKYGIISKILFFKKIPYCIIGTGLGPVTTQLGRWGVSSTLKNAKCISLRDPESVEYAKEIFADLNIKTCVDMVLSNLISKNEYHCEGFSKVAVHFGPMIERHINIDALIKLLKKIRSMNIYVGLVSDCKPPEGNSISVFDKLTRALGEEVEYIPYKGVDDFLKTLDRFGVILTSKLHGGILGYSKGLFPISVAEHVKTKRFYKQIGLEKYCFELSEEGFEKAINSLDEIRKNPKLAMELLSANRDTVKLLAYKNKEVLSNFMTSHFL